MVGRMIINATIPGRVLAVNWRTMIDALIAEVRDDQA